MIGFDSINFQWESSLNKTTRRLIIIVNDVNIPEADHGTYEEALKPLIKEILNNEPIH